VGVCERTVEATVLYISVGASLCHGRWLKAHQSALSSESWQLEFVANHPNLVHASHCVDDNERLLRFGCFMGSSTYSSTLSHQVSGTRFCGHESLCNQQISMQLVTQNARRIKSVRDCTYVLHFISSASCRCCGGAPRFEDARELHEKRDQVLAFRDFNQRLKSRGLMSTLRVRGFKKFRAEVMAAGACAVCGCERRCRRRGCCGCDRNDCRRAGCYRSNFRRARSYRCLQSWVPLQLLSCCALKAAHACANEASKTFFIFFSNCSRENGLHRSKSEDPPVEFLALAPLWDFGAGALIRQAQQAHI
jgi:hypothetical protein